MILENALSLSSVTGPTAHPTWILLRRCPSMRGTHCVALETSNSIIFLFLLFDNANYCLHSYNGW